MKKLLAIVLLIPLAIVVAQAQDTTAAKPDEAAGKMLIANERALQDAVAKGDKTSFESLVLLSDGFWATTDGFILFRQLADALQQFKLKQWDMVNPRVTWLDDNSAIVAYTWTGLGTLFDQPVTPMDLAITVWTKRNGRWLAVSHQQTALRRP